jgi:uncharacterized protein (TIGR03663 family)
MQQATIERRGFLDAPLINVLAWNWEKTAYAVLLVLALGLRLYGLGWRAMSHDESLHAVYSWQLYDGRGYQHNPMMHGPYQFYMPALSYFLFGVNDATARLPAAITGFLLVAGMWLLRRWLGRLGALLAALFITISPLLLYYSRYIREDPHALLWAGVTVLASFRYLEERQSKWLYLASVALVLMYASKEVAFIYTAIFVLFFALHALWSGRERGWNGIRATGSFDLVILLGCLSAPLFSPVLITFLGWNPQDYSSLGYVRSGAVWAFVQAAALALGWWHLRRRFVISLGLFYALFIPLFTTFFTNGQGLATGMIGSLGYWLAQQPVQRGTQPWYYYFLVVPLYEYMPFVLSLGGMIYLLLGVGRDEGRKDEVRPGKGKEPAREAAPSVPFVPFLAYWIVASWIAYMIAGEKMPWLGVHIAFPTCIFAGWVAGSALQRTDWRYLWARGGHWLALILPPLLFALGALLSTRPFRDRTISGLSATMQWLAALLVGGALVYLAWGYVRQLGWRATGRLLFAEALLGLTLLTVRTTVMANYYNYDNVLEYIGYAHATPDIKLVMDQIAEISRRTVGDKEIKVAYDDDSTWPLEWYLREYPNKVYYGASPSRDALDAPVVIVGDKNVDKAKPFLGDRYYQYKYRLIWWPSEAYKEITWAKFINGARDPAARKNLWNIIFYRKYTYSLNEWPHRHIFYLFVRKDVANQVWNLGPQAATAAAAQAAEDPYARGVRQVASMAQWGLGEGRAPGQLERPRNLAVDAEGNVYVVDTHNHRIQVFDPQGQVIRQWGSMCRLYDEGRPGCVDPDGGGPLAEGDGQFNEPWGIAVDDRRGFVYVADTWNHRIQKFTREGQFITKWGAYASTGGELTNPGAFWGPRALVVDEEGNLYVTDTGNKRVQKFSPDGTFLGQWGGAGVIEGRFDEPVGLARDKNGNFYVADTWNQRVQKFDKDFNYLGQWPIFGWSGQSVMNKPYLAVDDQGNVYASDPENYRILVFDEGGAFKAVFGQYGNDASSFALPTGLAVDQQGNLYVADADNHRILKFPPLR